MKPWLGAGAEVEVEVEAGAAQKSLPANGKKAAKRAPHEQIAAMEWIGMECALSCHSHTATARTSDRDRDSGGGGSIGNRHERQRNGYGWDSDIGTWGCMGRAAVVARRGVALSFRDWKS